MATCTASRSATSFAGAVSIAVVSPRLEPRNSGYQRLHPVLKLKIRIGQVAQRRQKVVVRAGGELQRVCVGAPVTQHGVMSFGPVWGKHGTEAVANPSSDGVDVALAEWPVTFGRELELRLCHAERRADRLGILRSQLRVAPGDHCRGPQTSDPNDNQGTAVRSYAPAE